jgi:hypothetical protein
MSPVNVNFRAMTAAFAARAFVQGGAPIAVDREKAWCCRSLKAAWHYDPLPGNPLFRDSGQKP